MKLISIHPSLAIASIVFSLNITRFPAYKTKEDQAIQSASCMKPSGWRLDLRYPFVEPLSSQPLYFPLPGPQSRDDKMSTTPTTTSGIAVDSHSTHGHHRGKRLRHFLLPDGKKVHIALSPEEASSLRQRLAGIPSSEPFDLVISGSPEHIDALRRAHSHHEERRQHLRDRYGETYDEFEHVRNELDQLGSELHMLTDHSVSLDANFSKFGYSAHLRTYDEGSTPGSGTSSLHDGDSHEKKDWEAEKRNGRIMKVYKKVVTSLTFLF